MSAVSGMSASNIQRVNAQQQSIPPARPVLPEYLNLVRNGLAPPAEVVSDRHVSEGESDRFLLKVKVGRVCIRPGTTRPAPSGSERRAIA